MAAAPAVPAAAPAPAPINAPFGPARDRAERRAQSCTSADQYGITLFVRRADAVNAGGLDWILPAIQTESVELQSEGGAALQAARSAGHRDVTGEFCPGRHHGPAFHLDGLGQRRGERITGPIAAGIDRRIHSHMQWRAVGDY